MYCYSPCYQRSRGSVPRFEQGEFRNTLQTDLQGVCISACGSVSAPVTHSDTATARMYCHSPCYQRSRGAPRGLVQGEFRNTPQKNPAGCLRLRLRLLPRKVSSLRVAPLRYFTGTPFTVSAPVTHSDTATARMYCYSPCYQRSRGSVPRFEQGEFRNALQTDLQGVCVYACGSVSALPHKVSSLRVAPLRYFAGTSSVLPTVAGGASRAFTRSISGRCIFLHRGERCSFFVRRGAYILYNVFTLRAAGSKMIDEIHRRALARKGKK